MVQEGVLNYIVIRTEEPNRNSIRRESISTSSSLLFSSFVKFNT